MAKFEGKIPMEYIKQFNDHEAETIDMINEMVDAGADYVLKEVKKNMKSVFKRTDSIERGLKKTVIYKTPSDDGINAHVGFYGYYKEKATKKFPKGVPYALIAKAREYGSKSGEAKKPFFRKAFKKKEIEAVMKSVQDKYIKGD